MDGHGPPPCTVEDKEEVFLRFGGELGVENALKVYLDDNVKKFCFANTTSYNEEYQNYKKSRQAVFAVSNGLIVGGVFGMYETDANSSEDDTSEDDTSEDDTSEDESSEDESSEDESSGVKFGIHRISNEDSEVDLEQDSAEEDSEEEDSAEEESEEEDSEEEDSGVDSEEDSEMDFKINVGKHSFIDETDDSGDESIDMMFGPLGDVTDSTHGHWIIGSHCVSQMYRQYGVGRYLMIRLLQKMLSDKKKPVILEVNKLGDEGVRHDMLVKFYQNLNFHVIASDGTWGDGVRVWKSEEFRHRSTYMMLPVDPVFTVA
jgi:hypothetical protein